jgi:hypothetical protein
MSFGSSFGGGSSFNSSSIFGSSSTQNQFKPTGGGLFGSSAATTATASPLGASTTSSPFSTGFGGFSSTAATTQPTTGTTIKFAALPGQDQISKNGSSQTTGGFLLFGSSTLSGFGSTPTSIGFEININDCKKIN